MYTERAQHDRDFSRFCNHLFFEKHAEELDKTKCASVDDLCPISLEEVNECIRAVCLHNMQYLFYLWIHYAKKDMALQIKPLIQ